MSAHEEVKELLPWFVNGSLNESEQSIVNKHLETCDECRLDVEQLLMMAKEFSATVDFDDEWDDYVEASSNGFLRQLDQPVESKPHRRQPLVWVSSAVACSLIVVVATLIIPVGDVYRTLGRSPAIAHEAPVVQVVFRPDAKEESIRTLLLEGDNQVLSGPTRQGVYRVLLGKEQNSDVYVARLSHHPDVIFVQKEAEP